MDDLYARPCRDEIAARVLAQQPGTANAGRGRPVAGRGGPISTPQLAAEAGVTFRQLDYWTRAGLLRPEWRWGERGAGQGGRSRYWDTQEREAARLMGLLTAVGIRPRIAGQVARSPGGRYEIAPGISIHVDKTAKAGENCDG
jgi:hypothetical protein